MQIKALKLSRTVGMLGSQPQAAPVHLGLVRANIAVVLAPPVAILEGEGEVGVASTSIPGLTSDMLDFCRYNWLAAIDVSFCCTKSKSRVP